MTPGTGETEQLLHLIERRLPEHKGGRRLWLEGKRLTDVGFKAGVRYQLVPGEDTLTLRLSRTGDHVVSGKGSRPVVDIHPTALGNVDRVEVRMQAGAVLVSIHPLDLAAARRIRRLNRRLAAGDTLRLGSICHGGGVASDALLRGLGNTSLAFAVEQDASYVAQSLEHGPLAQGGMSVEADLGDIDPSILPEVDVLEAGLPCISASRAGRAKKALAQAEDDDATADLVVAFLDIVRATAPLVVVLENVPEYATTASAAIIRRRLGRWGYECTETVLHGAQWSLEARDRWVLVATTHGMSLDLNLTPAARPAALGEVLDKKTPAAAWRSTASFEAKKARDEANGNGFSRGRRFLTAADTSVPTLRRGYQKGGNCDPRLAHPSRPGVARLFSAAEHARIKGIPPALVAGLSEKKAHEVLGQSVISPAFTALGAAIAAAL